MKANPVFWLMWLLPGAAVVAGFATLVIALGSADRPLPASYHWEGARLDADFERARNAAQHGMRAELTFAGGAQPCTAMLTPAPGDPPSITLTFTSTSNASLDRALTMRREQPGVYRVECDALPRGRWLITLQDSAGQWALRGSLDDRAQVAVLDARDPAGGGA
jgi:hypothetical protein